MPLYLGIDAGTQSIKAIVIDDNTIVAEAGVHFGTDLPQYVSPNGFLPHEDPTIRHANPQMWVDALHLAFKRLAETGVDLSQVRGISGSGQQHGSVYVDSDFNFTRPTAPIWMDRSTRAECDELDARFGDRLQSETGSPAIERFTGPQIRKFFKDEPETYAATQHIHLVSSFLCSLLIGKSAPIDTGDGAGMNMLNLNTLQWDEEITEFTAPGLLAKLPPVVTGNTIAGGLAESFATYGFKPGIPVIVWSGDNPNSLVGVGASEPGVAGISLGTSDTFFAAMPKFCTDPEGCGHVFGNPGGGFMSLICFSNGSLAREKVKEELNVDWKFFDNDALAETPFGNNGKMMLPYFEAESTPLVLNPSVKYNFTEATTAERVRAILESQVLSMRHHTGWLGQKFARIRVTGGASRSAGMRQLIADIFQAQVETINVTNSAGLGAAMRAASAVDGTPLATLAERFCQSVEITQPNPAHAAKADEMLAAFAAFEVAKK